MKNSYICSLVFFYVLLVSVRSDVIQDSCSKAAQDDPNIKLDFCVSTFAGNPKAESATSVADLVPVSIENAKTNATSMVSIVSQLLLNKSLEKYARSCLEDCHELYSDAGSSLQTGEEAFQSKDYGTANVMISGAMDAPEVCEDQFKDREGFVSPLTKENDGFFHLTAIILAFLNMAQNG